MNRYIVRWIFYAIVMIGIVLVAALKEVAVISLMPVLLFLIMMVEDTISE